MIEIKKREGETASGLMFRFSKRVRQSGLSAEVRRRRFRARPQNQQKRRLAAIHRVGKKTETMRLKKLGLA